MNYYSKFDEEKYYENELFKYNTESISERIAIWDEVEYSIDTLDSSYRGTNARDNAFIVIWYEKSGISVPFMQYTPEYPKQSFFRKIFGLSEELRIDSYNVEIGTGEKIYRKVVNTKEEIKNLFKNFYETGNIPDISDWEDTGIL